ncbi:Hypothetical protein LUCI_0290 [Lucifera butyrica]|uniref:Uncharacterized protein n=1 Tax=Lucifera butyrica TaxID=1351585 RepID=A0A498R0W8_9FIRM|nr:hypothetical protein [Lucifera butyrica]VBB05084.1 Hypothetical protein LUCI_0290 [Lucifera butyrica]
MTKADLIRFIEELPEERMAEVLSLLNAPSDYSIFKNEVKVREEAIENVNCFLADLSGSIAAALYDLSNEAQKENNNILANRLRFSMKKIKESWTEYKTKQKPYTSQPKS